MVFYLFTNNSTLGSMNTPTISRLQPGVLTGLNKNVNLLPKDPDQWNFPVL